MDFLNKYSPINTSEKVFMLLHDIKSIKTIPLTQDEFINQIAFQIRKKNIQELFRENISIHIQTIKFKKTNQIQKNDKKEKQLNVRPHKISKEEKFVQTIKKQQEAESAFKQRTESYKNRENKKHSISLVSPNSFIGKSLKEAAFSLNVPKQALENILIKHEIETNKIFSKKDLSIVKKDIDQLKKQSLDEKLNESVISNETFMKRNQRLSPTKGKEGNYFKLIYNHPKS